MRKIHIGKGFYALVDDEDYERVSNRKWYPRIMPNTIYVNEKTTGKWGISLHRFIMNAKSGFVVDHINHNGLDNRKSNLRLCSHMENCYNSKLSRANKTGYKGVWWDKKRRKFEAYITANKKRKNLGRFELACDAAMAYNIHADELHGEYAFLNISPMNYLTFKDLMT